MVELSFNIQILHKTNNLGPLILNLKIQPIQPWGNMYSGDPDLPTLKSGSGFAVELTYNITSKHMSKKGHTLPISTVLYAEQN